MTDFVSRLVERTLEPPPSVQPVIAPAFARTVAGQDAVARGVPNDETGVRQTDQDTSERPREGASPSASPGWLVSAGPSHGPREREQPSPAPVPREESPPLPSRITSSHRSAGRVQPDPAAGRARPEATSADRLGEIVTRSRRAEIAGHRDAGQHLTGLRVRRAPAHDANGRGRAGRGPENSSSTPTQDSLAPLTPPRERRPAPAGDDASAPDIRVTIGRVEVRAVGPHRRQPAAPKPSRPAPRLTLDTYLGERDGGLR